MTTSLSEVSAVWGCRFFQHRPLWGASCSNPVRSGVPVTPSPNSAIVKGESTSGSGSGTPNRTAAAVRARYINLWLPDKPFSLPRVQDTSSWVGEFIASCDDKSGFHQFLMKPTSWKYMCFRWRGRTYCYCALPFGMKLSPWFYQMFSEAPVLFLRRHGIPGHVYIDNGLVSDGQGLPSPSARRRQMCVDAFYAFADLRTRVGHFISRKKSNPFPSRLLKHLGIQIDCEKREFRVPEDKIVKFKARIVAYVFCDIQSTL